MILEPAVQQENQPKPHQKLNQYIIKYIKGDFSRKQLFWHVTAGTILIIACFVVSGTLSTNFNIMANSFSALGSWVSWHNPRGWFVFSVGLVVSIFVVLPLIPYQHCRIKYANRALSNLVSVYLGCLCFLMVAFFPVMSSSISGGKVTFQNVHVVSALSGGVLFIFGYCMLFVLVMVDRCRMKIVFGPVFTFSISFLVIFFILALIANLIWIVIYPYKYKEDPSIGEDRNDASSFSFYSFSMWENLGIYLIFAFFLTSPFMLQQRSDGKFTIQNESKRLFPKQERIQLKTELSDLKRLFPLIKRIQLKTELSVMWYQIIKKKKCIQRWKQCRLLEYMADYQLVEGLVDDEIVQVLYQVAESNESQQILEVKQYEQNPAYEILRIAVQICKLKPKEIGNKNNIVIVQPERDIITQNCLCSFYFIYQLYQIKYFESWQFKTLSQVTFLTLYPFLSNDLQIKKIVFSNSIKSFVENKPLIYQRNKCVY
ncbi:Conserved_hypothetical protein [Hexamita inflata]|uniref:Uncharacterized protein n=1 Tax=Hexamita inflata TaxID=28002 RepID=A0AA86R2K4_9EUKA|nr:Conserved hypothetical protein [Hexamita inflata]